jgi:hypothetical protein
MYMLFAVSRMRKARGVWEEGGPVCYLLGFCTRGFVFLTIVDRF